MATNGGNPFKRDNQKLKVVGEKIATFGVKQKLFFCDVEGCDYPGGPTADALRTHKRKHNWTQERLEAGREKAKVRSRQNHLKVRGNVGSFWAIGRKERGLLPILDKKSKEAKSDPYRKQYLSSIRVDDALIDYYKSYYGLYELHGKRDPGLMKMNMTFGGGTTQENQKRGMEFTMFWQTAKKMQQVILNQHIQNKFASSFIVILTLEQTALAYDFARCNLPLSDYPADDWVIYPINIVPA